MITSPIKPKTIGLAAAAGQTQTDNRFGARGIAPLQKNAATVPYKTSIRPQLTQLQKTLGQPISAPQPIQPVTAANTNQSANGTPLNQTQAPIGTPQFRPRPQFDPNAVNGAPVTPTAPIQAPAPATLAESLSTMNAKATTPTTSLSATLPTTTTLPSGSVTAPITNVTTPGATSGGVTTQADVPFGGQKPFGMSDGQWAQVMAQYNQEKTDTAAQATQPIDSRVDTAMNTLAQGTNINVVGDQPVNPGRFDTAANAFNPNVTGQVAANVNQFNPNISSAGSSFQISDPGARNASFFDRATSEYGTNQPIAPGQVAGVTNPSTVGREGGIGQTDAERQATEAQLKVANAAAANGGMMTNEQIQAQMDPYIRAAQAQAADASSRGNALLAKASGGAGLDTQSVADVARQASDSANNTIGTKFSDIMSQNLANRGSMLNTASGALSDVGTREAGKSTAGAQLGVEQRGQDVTQRSQDVESNLTQRTQNIGQRQDDMNFLTQNANRLSSDMLGLAGLDITKYTSDGNLNVDKYKADITRQMQDRGVSLDEANAKTDQYFKALNATMDMTQSEKDNQVKMADLAQKADQGDVQATLEHSNQLLQQAVSSGQLTNDQTQTMLNSLYQYWNQPQQLALAYAELKNRLKVAETGKQGSNVGINVGGFGINIPTG